MTLLLDPALDVVRLTADVVDVPSVSGDESELADAVEAALAGLDHLEVLRDGDTVIARTYLGRASRVLIAGHLDTVPIAGNIPSEIRMVDGEERLYGRGSCDMKGGVAVALKLAAELVEPARDVTWVFYDHEEVAASLNSLGRLTVRMPEVFAADFAILMEPTAAAVEGGCKGTLRADVTAHGRAAHAGRAWMGHNAIHDLAPALSALAAYEPEDVEVDGLVYRECLNAVHIEGGIAGNVIPDHAQLQVNYRFAPNVTPDEAEERVRRVLAHADVDVEIVDIAAGALPGLSSPAARAFLDALGDGVDVRAKQGWTDVARFSELGVPAVNYGPGDPLKAHADDEYAATAQIRECHRALGQWLRGSTGSATATPHGAATVGEPGTAGVGEDAR